MIGSSDKTYNPEEIFHFKKSESLANKEFCVLYQSNSGRHSSIMQYFWGLIDYDGQIMSLANTYYVE